MELDLLMYPRGTWQVSLGKILLNKRVIQGKDICFQNEQLNYSNGLLFLYCIRSRSLLNFVIFFKLSSMLDDIQHTYLIRVFLIAWLFVILV